MSVTQLYLIRHGETTWNAEGRLQGQSESNLSERGVAQATERSSEILGYGFDARYCSSSQRTRETIYALLSGGVEDVVYRDDLREIMLGPWQGRLIKELRQENPELYEQFSNQPEQFELEGAETFQALQNRGVGALQQIADAHPGQRVLVVSHGALIKSCLLHWLQWPLAQMWAEPLIPNCSFSVLEFSPEQGGRVVSIADSEV